MTFNEFHYVVPIYVSSHSAHIPNTSTHLTVKKADLKNFFKHLKSQDFHYGHVGENDFFFFYYYYYYFKAWVQGSLYLPQHNEQTRSDRAELSYNTDTPCGALA